jgi:hypothetical protein
MREDYNPVMIFGVHLLLMSRNPEADRTFFRDVLEMPAVDAGGGWLIFGMPPAEIAVHPSEAPLTTQQVGQDLAAATVYLMCDNLAPTLDWLAGKGVEHTEIHQERWGVVSTVGLPGGGRLGLYEPRHPTAVKTAAG